MKKDVVRAIECCLRHNCGQCGYDIGNAKCLNNLMQDVLEYIEKLETDFEYLNGQYLAQDMTMSKIKTEAIKELIDKMDKSCKVYGKNDVEYYIKSGVDIILDEMGYIEYDV